MRSFVRPTREVHLKALTPYLALSVLVVFVPFNVGAQQSPYQQEDSTPVAQTEAWIGCWVLRATNDAQVTRLDSVRLLSVGVPGRDRRTYYRGLRMHEKAGHFTKSVTWSLSQQGDTAEIRVEALGGTVWRLEQESDSLVGYAYATFDVVPGEDLFGRATGRRVKC
jgi:hypothetical protein